jgi:Family of unknown function (DUF695)
MEWATAVSKHNENGRVITFRFAEEFHPEFDRTSQPDRIIIAWKYASETGQPMLTEHQRMNLLEDKLERLLAEECATLALVSTGENLREWVYYTRSEDEFMARLGEALAGTTLPLEIYTAVDPTWNSYEAFKDHLRSSTDHAPEHVPALWAR